VNDKRTFILRDADVRSRASSYVLLGAPADSVCTVRPETRTLSQNAKFHALCGDISKSHMTFGGRELSRVQWKTLLVSGHSTATGRPSELVIGLEGELVDLRESTAQMEVPRASSLIEYTLAWCALHGVELREYADA
jgi:hypothetical protein